MGELNLRKKGAGREVRNQGFPLSSQNFLLKQTCSRGWKMVWINEV
jgi:hypothetical protein